MWRPRCSARPATQVWAFPTQWRRAGPVVPSCLSLFMSPHQEEAHSGRTGVSAVHAWHCTAPNVMNTAQLILLPFHGAAPPRPPCLPVCRGAAAQHEPHLHCTAQTKPDPTPPLSTSFLRACVPAEMMIQRSKSQADISTMPSPGGRFELGKVSKFGFKPAHERALAPRRMKDRITEHRSECVHGFCLCACF